VGVKHPREFERAFSAMRSERADALLVLFDAMFFEVSVFASKCRLGRRIPSLTSESPVRGNWLVVEAEFEPVSGRNSLVQGKSREFSPDFWVEAIFDSDSAWIFRTLALGVWKSKYSPRKSVVIHCH
jgi:hypothetical protein